MPPPHQIAHTFPYTTLCRSWDEMRRLLVDFRDRRLADMDANGIEFAILGLNSPALQAILDSTEASNVARRANILAAEIRSEEHTSELQSLRHLVYRLLHEKK